ncbi:mitochondrial genome maintenance exonuclease 1 [Rhynchocyon petersi]
MKAFQNIYRLLRGSKRFSVVPASCVSFSTSYSCGWKKKMNSYEKVDQEKYSNLVQSVVSFRNHVRTPESLFEEDALLHGPVCKQKSPKQEEEARAPQNWFPLFNPEKRVKSNTICNPSIPLKIPLQRNVIPSVTRILQQTMTEEQIFYLERWKQHMILELGEDGFSEYKSNTFLHGKKFHATLESILSQGSSTERDGHLQSGYIESVRHVLKDVSGVRVLESAVQHKALNYVGLLDCVAEYQGKLCVIDWKTSEKQKPLIRNTYDNPLQVVAYIGALNHDVNYSFQVQCGLIVVAYKDGSPAHPHFMDTELCSQYWARWLLRLEKYTEMEKNQNFQKLD